MSGSEGRDDKLGGCAAAGVVEEEGGFTLNSHGRGGLRGKSVPRRGGRAGAGMWCKMECLAILVMACMSCAREGGCKESRDNGVLGEWASNPETISRLAGEFSSAAPFPHIVIPNFFSDVSLPKPDPPMRRGWVDMLWAPHSRNHTPCRGKSTGDLTGAWVPNALLALPHEDVPIST